MTKLKVTGNGHKVVAPKEINKRVADICSKYGIEFNDEMLHRTPEWGTSKSFWSFLPYTAELVGPTGKVLGHPKAGMILDDTNLNNWRGCNADKEDFDEDSIAAFDEITAVLREATTDIEGDGFVVEYPCVSPFSSEKIVSMSQNAYYSSGRKIKLVFKSYGLEIYWDGKLMEHYSYSGLTQKCIRERVDSLCINNA